MVPFDGGNHCENHYMYIFRVEKISAELQPCFIVRVSRVSRVRVRVNVKVRAGL